ncbi:hypothetical protein CERSUDRAFT_89617 [Gelatoporia subvermispora B]|uniref:AB hydrolase-1 domain-containing protein n=1 Tax=Ceriporiopsis subvermispora (strain B) TaxID=914234 RepID=M2Q292_CERS8|nr:hypothetical protein CERSUDRAFT_89617 [Gelatoporia subvermispora B]
MAITNRFPIPTDPLSPPTCSPRQLAPIESPPLISDFPKLPSAPRISLLDPYFSVTTHLVPAAFPRTAPDVPVPGGQERLCDPASRKEAASKAAEAIVSNKMKQWEGKAGSGSRKLLWVCWNRYVNKTPRGQPNRTPLTLLCAHAGSSTKEMWEPVLRHVFNATSNYHVDEIWSFDAFNHGDSHLVNANSLGGIVDWHDNTRDILQFLLHYFPIDANSALLPTHLPRIDDHIATARARNGSASRTLVGLGHSFGAVALLRAAIAHPVLFSSIIVADPTIQPAPDNGPFVTQGHQSIIHRTVQRSDHFRSRAEARRRFKAVPALSAWDPSMMDVYIDHGLMDNPDGTVKLKTPSIHEAMVYADARSQYEVWELLPILDERVELMWIMPGLDVAEKQLRPEKAYEIRQNSVWRRAKNASNIRIPDTSHFLVHEKPKDTARVINAFLERKYGDNETAYKL